MSRDKRIDAYIKEAAPFARPILLHLRSAVHRANPEIEEAIKWNAPFFLYRGSILCFFAAFSKHVAFGFWGPAMKKFIANDGLKTQTAMGSLGRIESADDLPDDRTLARYLKTAIGFHDQGDGVRIVRKVKPEMKTPPALLEALRKNTRASSHWEKFTPGKRREYIEWINAAKRDETREQRLMTTVEWVSEGKIRNWKYQDC